MSNETTLDDVLALVAKATPGEWRAVHKGVLKSELAGTEVYGVMSDAAVCPCVTGPMDAKDSLPDAEAIAAAVNYLRAHGDELRAALGDARRYNKLKPMMTAANFYPEDPNGLDLGEGVALIFMLPVGTPVCSKLDSIIDAIDAAQEVGK